MSAQRIHAVRWIDVATSSADRIQVAREMVAVLLQRPQQPADAPAALRVRDADLPGGPPLSFRLLDRRMYWSGSGAPEPDSEAQVTRPPPSAPPAGRQFETRALSLAQKRGDMAWDPQPMSRSNNKRPGQSGRPNKHREISEARVLREVTERFGDFEHRVIGGIHEYVWTLHRDGDGMVLARLSGPELKRGDTVGTQVHTALMFAERMDLRPRELVVTLQNSGANSMQRRVDLQRVIDGWLAGWLRWELWRGADRMFRRGSVEHLHYEWLQDTGVGLYLSELGHRVDWRNEIDLMWLDFAGAQARSERRTTQRRTEDAKIDRFLSQGRGWPNSVKFGTYRDDETFLAVDTRVPKGHALSDWEMVHWIKRRYVELCRTRRGGIGPLEAELRERGYQFCGRYLVKLLQDPLYVDGNWSVTFAGQRYSCEPLRGLGACPRSQPVSRELHQQVLDLLAVRKGPHTATPEGTFLLNAVPFVHARCMHQRKEIRGQQMQPRLRARSYPEERKIRPTYSHRQWVPEGCHGWTLEQQAVESAVVAKLLEVAETEELQHEWLEADRSRSSGRPALVHPAAMQRLQAELAALQEARDKQKRIWLAGVRAGQGADLVSYQGMLGDLDREIARLQAEIAGERPGEQPPPEPPGPAREELVERMRAVLTPDTPEDLSLRVQRAALLRHCLSAVVAHDTEEGVVLELQGPLVPRNARLAAEEHGPRGGARRWLQEEEEADADRLARGEGVGETRTHTSPTGNEECSSFAVGDLLSADVPSYHELRRRLWDGVLGPHSAGPPPRKTRVKVNGGEMADHERLFPAWRALTEPIRARAEDTWKRDRAVWTGARAVEVLAQALVKEPTLFPLTSTSQPKLAALVDLDLPSSPTLQQICRREAQWNRAKEIRDAAMRRYFELRAQGAPTPHELAQIEGAARPGPRRRPSS